MPPRPNAVKQWVATLNNPTPLEYDQLRESCESLSTYSVIGREVGATGTPHLQCFFIWTTRKRLGQCKLILGLQRAHLEVKLSNSTSEQAATYCKKDGDFWETGTLPTCVAKLNVFESFRDWYKEQPSYVTERSILDNCPQILRYPGFIEVCHRQYGKRPILVEGDLRNWQVDLNNMLDQPPGDRKITFVVDPEGNKGKSWLTRYWFSHRDDMQMLSIGKRDDLAYAVDPSKRVFVFDIPRDNMQFFQYTVAEQLKNRMIISNKYKSGLKVLHHQPHVIVFCNEDPDRTKLTDDRYQVKRITPL